MASQYLIAFAVATKVKVLSNISSFLFTPRDFKARCNAEVPELVASTYFEFVNFFILFSNFATSGPA